MERTTAPTVLDGVQALHWLHAAAEEGLGAGSAGAGHQVGAGHQGLAESEGPGGSRWPHWGKNGG